jgi:hypothetical protein
MIKHFAHFIAVAGLVVLLAGPAIAQNDEIGPAARANIPFDFYAGTASFPAGTYTFDLDPVAHVVTIEPEAAGRATYLVGMPATPVQSGKALLTFEKVGDKYKLEELQSDVGGVEFSAAQAGAAGSYEVHDDMKAATILSYKVGQPSKQ